MSSRSRIGRALAALAAAVALAALPAGAQATTPQRAGPPGSMDALGDSITRGFNACPTEHAYSDCPEGSFSTGTKTAINPHYLRIRAMNAAINGKNFNDAVTGAKVSALNAQAAAAVTRNPDYVTVLIGANDACTSTESAMTSVTSFRSSFQTAINTLKNGLPNARIYVVSVPDIWKLWNLGKGNFAMTFTWNLGGICQSLLDNPDSTAQADVDRRARVRQRVVDYNTQMQQVCATVLRCKWDGGTAHGTDFEGSEVSNLDAFHPNEAGQTKAATVTWNAGPKFTDGTPPTTMFSPSRAPDGAGGWYDHAVDVTLGATDPNSGIAGTEYLRRPGPPSSFTTYASSALTVSGEGDHEIEARSVDVNTNVEGSKVKAITIDSTDPSLSLTLPPADGNSGKHRVSPVVLDVSGTDDRAVHSLACTLDGQPSAISVGDVSVSADGDHTVECTVTDRAGNTATATREFTLDATAPVTAVDDGPGGPTHDATPEFRFSADEDGATFRCAIDGNDLGDCDSPLTLDEQDDGEHTFSVVATDEAGNADATPAVRTFTVDTAPPSGSIDSSPPPLTNDAAATVAFSADEDGTFACELDAEPVTPCASPQALGTLPDGSHTFRLTATDAAGNSDPTPATATWDVDTAAPAADITGGPGGPTNDPTPSFDFGADEDGSTFECRIDSAAFEPCSSGDDFAAGADGSHTFQVTATDEAGNEGPAASRTFTLDTAAPDTTLGTGGPNGPTNAQGGSFSGFASTESGTFECQLDSGNWAACTMFTVGTLDDGPHTFRVRAVDAAGNRDATPATRAWTLDTHAPQTQIDDAPTGHVSFADAEVDFSSDEGGVSYECKIDGGVWQAGCSSPRQLTGLGDGPHSVLVRATDAAGNVDATPAESGWVVDTTAPVTAIDDGPDALTNQRDASFDFSSDDDGSFECRLDGGAWVSCSPPKAYHALADGDHVFEVRSTDEAGNPEATAARRDFRVDTAPPQTAIDSGPDAATTSRAAAFAFSSEAGATFECRLDDGAWAACTSPRSYSDLAVGGHAFAVRATDAAGNPDETPAQRSWAVTLPPPRTSVDTGADAGTGGGDPGAGTGSPGAGEPTLPAVCRFGVPAPGCAAPQLQVGLSLPRRGRSADAKLLADSGGYELRRLVLRLPRGMASSFRTATPGAAGAIQLRSSTRVLTNAQLRLRKRARSAVLLSSRGEKVVLRYGSSPRIEITGLPATVTRVQLTLKGNTLGFAPAATCKPTVWAVDMTDQAAGQAAARGTAPAACRSRRTRGG